MAWRVFLEGHTFDLDVLTGALSDGQGDLVVAKDGDSHFLTGDRLRDAATAADALRLARDALQMINGVGRACDSAFRPVRLTDSLVDDRDPTHRYVFVESRMEARSRLTLSGEAVASGTAPSNVSVRAVHDQVLLEAVARFGVPDLDWSGLWKVYEVLREGAGNEDALRKRFDLTKPQLSRFTLTANHPEASGEQARHARLSQRPPKDPMSLDEGSQFIRDLINRW